MYLSRLNLNTRHREVWLDIGDCHRMHSTLMRAFPQSSSNGSRNFYQVLYRREIREDLGSVFIYVQSRIEPDWFYLEKNGYLDDTSMNLNPACKDVGKHYRNIKKGALLSFILKANPTKKIGTSSKEERLKNNKKNGTRVPVNGIDEQVSWLQRKGKQGGFDLIPIDSNDLIMDVSVISGLIEKGKKPLKKGKRTITLQGVLFKGHLVVTDSDNFYDTLTKGIGSGKAYGFGLLSVTGIRER